MAVIWYYVLCVKAPWGNGRLATLWVHDIHIGSRVVWKAPHGACTNACCEI